MLFEAGSVSALGHERVCTVFVDLLPEDVTPPFNLFHGTNLERSDVHRLLRQLNEITPSPLEDKALEKSFNRAWPELEESLRQARENHGESVKPKKPATDETLNAIRQAVFRIESRLMEMETVKSDAIETLAEYMEANTPPDSLALAVETRNAMAKIFTNVATRDRAQRDSSARLHAKFVRRGLLADTDQVSPPDTLSQPERPSLKK